MEAMLMQERYSKSHWIAHDEQDARSLEICGAVEAPLQLCTGALSRLPSRVVPRFVVNCKFDGVHGAPLRYRATPLAPLIERSRPTLDRQTDFKRLAIIGESSEGYRSMFTWMELFHTRVGAGVLVAYDCEDAPFEPRAGRFALLSLYDEYTGPRYVRDLVRLRVVRIW